MYQKPKQTNNAHTHTHTLQTERYCCAHLQPLQSGAVESARQNIGNEIAGKFAASKVVREKFEKMKRKKK